MTETGRNQMRMQVVRCLKRISLTSLFFLSCLYCAGVLSRIFYIPTAPPMIYALHHHRLHHCLFQYHYYQQKILIFTEGGKIYRKGEEKDDRMRLEVGRKMVG